MSTMQSALSRIFDIQRNAQANVPVLPNNGNPAGAYNMPYSQAPQGAGLANPNTGAMPPHMRPQLPAQAQGPLFPWLQSSPSMNIVRQFLANRAQFGQAQAIQPEQPIVPPVPQQMPMPNRMDEEMRRPILPQYRNQMVP